MKDDFVFPIPTSWQVLGQLTQVEDLPTMDAPSMLNSHAARPLVLVAEDEPDISAILVAYLEQAGFRTVTAFDGDTALSHAHALKPDLMLLDLQMPQRDGFSVLSGLRVENQLPVIVVSALADDLDKLSALRIGADDYVTKPFNPKEVVARVEAVLRRVQAARGVVSSGHVLKLGRLSVDTLAHQAAVQGRLIVLTLSEYKLLAHLMRRQGQVHTRSALLDACLEDSDALERTVDSHISNLRRKLVAAGAGVALITVRGVGYRLELDTDGSLQDETQP